MLWQSNERKCEREHFLYQSIISETGPHVRRTVQMVKLMDFVRIIFAISEWYSHFCINFRLFFLFVFREMKLNTNYKQWLHSQSMCLSIFFLRVFLFVCGFLLFHEFPSEKKYICTWIGGELFKNTQLHVHSISNEANSYVNSRMSISLRRNNKHVLTTHTHIHISKNALWSHLYCSTFRYRGALFCILFC